MLRSATFRLAAVFSLAFTLAALVLGVMIYRAVGSELHYELQQRVLAERAVLLREARLGAGLAATIDAQTRHGARDTYYSLLNRRGALLAGSAVRNPPAAGWTDALSFTDQDGREDDARALVTPLADGGRLIIGVDPESVERLDEKMGWLLIAVFGAMALIGVAGGFLLSAALRRRLDAITATAEAIIGGDLTQRMPVGATGDEFDRLSETLNRMLDRIDALLANLRQLSGDLAHDLRTPLTRLRQKLDLPDLTDADPVILRSAIEQAGAHADELMALFAGLLEISEVEAGGALRLKPVDLSALVADIADSYVPAAEDSGRVLTREIAPELMIDGQRELVAQLLVNLLDNALRHTPPGATVAVSLAPAGDRVQLTIADDGPGIPADERERVFERFVRLERSRTTPGHGLGLRLVAAIATAHGATVTLTDNHPGVRMMIDFKRGQR